MHVALLSTVVWALLVGDHGTREIPWCTRGDAQSAAYVGHEQCHASAAPNTCYFKGSNCVFYAALVCTDCCYGASGGFEQEKSYLCGVCIGGEF